MSSGTRAHRIWGGIHVHVRIICIDIYWPDQFPERKKKEQAHDKGDSICKRYGFFHYSYSANIGKIKE
jgi:hypothetical protein